MDMYCPQCRSMCGGEACPTDDRGRCKHCGKPPVAAADRDRPWLWCIQHDQWHGRACSDNSARHCCAPPPAA